MSDRNKKRAVVEVPETLEELKKDLLTSIVEEKDGPKAPEPMPETEVAIFKLINGEEIISKVTQTNNSSYILTDTMLVVKALSRDNRVTFNLMMWTLGELDSVYTLPKSSVVIKYEPGADILKAYTRILETYYKADDQEEPASTVLNTKDVTEEGFNRILLDMMRGEGKLN
jgi:hypothetical protein